MSTKRWLWFGKIGIGVGGDGVVKERKGREREGEEKFGGGDLICFMFHYYNTLARVASSTI